MKTSMAIIGLMCLVALSAACSEVHIAWDASPDSRTTEYMVYQGGATYHFTVTAFSWMAAQESVPANDLSYTVPYATINSKAKVLKIGTMRMAQ